MKDIIRIVIRSREQRSWERRKWKSSSAIALAPNHVSFSSVEFQKRQEEGEGCSSYKSKEAGRDCWH